MLELMDSMIVQKEAISQLEHILKDYPDLQRQCRILLVCDCPLSKLFPPNDWLSFPSDLPLQCFLNVRLL